MRNGHAQRVVAGHLIRADPDIVAPHDEDSRTRRDPCQVSLGRGVGPIVGVYTVRRDEHIARLCPRVEGVNDREDSRAVPSHDVATDDDVVGIDNLNSDRAIGSDVADYARLDVIPDIDAGIASALRVIEVDLSVVGAAWISSIIAVVEVCPMGQGVSIDPTQKNPITNGVLDRESDECKVSDRYCRANGNAIRSLTKDIGANMDPVCKAACIDDRALGS